MAVESWGMIVGGQHYGLSRLPRLRRRRAIPVDSLDCLTPFDLRTDTVWSVGVTSMIAFCLSELRNRLANQLT